MWPKKKENTKKNHWFEKVLLEKTLNKPNFKQPNFYSPLSKLVTLNLNPKEKAALILQQKQHYNETQVADILGLSKENLENLLKTIKRKLNP